MFVGIIIYIGAITEEAGNRPKSIDEPRFLYWYGPSFALTFTSFIGSELTGVLAVHLYVARRRLRCMERRCAREAGRTGETDNGTSADGLGADIGAVAADDRTLTGRSGASLASKIFAAVFAANGSPSKNMAKMTTALATASIEDRVVVTSTSGGGGGSTSRKQKNRRRRSSITLADRQLLSPGTGQLLGGVASRRESELFDDDEESAAIIGGGGGGGTHAPAKTRPDSEKHQPTRPPSTASCSRYNSNCNNHGRSASSSAFPISGHQHQSILSSAATTTRSVTNSPGAVSSGPVYFAGCAPSMVPDGGFSPMRSVGHRSPMTNYYYYYNTMTSLPPQSASSRDTRLHDMASGVGLVSRAWSIDGFDSGIRRITNV
jgi:hypothetical protein